MDKFYKLFKATYALTKTIVGLNKSKPKKLIHYLLILLTFGIFMLSILIITILYLTHFFVEIYIRIKYDKKYGGMLKGQDFLMECSEKVIAVNLVLIIKRNSCYEDFEKTLRQNFNQIHESCCKLKCEIGSALGNKFFIKTDAKFEDVFAIVDNVVLNKNTLADYLQENFTDTDSTLKNKAWKLFVFKEPIIWSGNNKNPEHVIILVFRHSICDGISLLSLLANKLEGLEPISFGLKLKPNPMNVRTVLFQEAYIYDDSFIQEETLNKSVENYISFYIEDNIKYIPLIKSIKNKLNVGFADVLVGCLAVALVNYGKMENKNINSVKLYCTLRSFDKETIDLMEGRFNYDEITNKITLLALKGQSNIDLLTIKEVVQMYNNEGKKMRAGEDCVFSNVLGNIAHIATVPVARRLLKLLNKGSTGVVTNLVGLKSATISGNVIECGFGFVPFVSPPVGFVLFVWSLRDKFQLCLSGPKSVVDSRKDLDIIFKEMFKNIDRLSCEVGCRK